MWERAQRETVEDVIVTRIPYAAPGSNSLCGLIEILGLPGAGKTSACAHLGAHRTCLEGDVPNDLRTSSYFSAISMFIRSPLFTFVLYMCILTRRGVRLQNLLYGFAVQRRFEYLRRLKASGIPAIVDEGPTHGIFIALFGTSSTVASTPLLRLALKRIGRLTDGFFFSSMRQSAIASKDYSQGICPNRGLTRICPIRWLKCSFEMRRMRRYDAH